ncbi:hypothetical protein PI126_g15202 [Phytophthora idaei]|nr:hypothetical protein PI126_g15202 [Phytophthora idaei]
MFERFRRVEISERSSYLSSIKFSRPEAYGELRSPREEEGRCSNDGALRDGGAPRLLSAESCGLLAQYAAVGLMMGALPSAVTPFLGYYLNMEGQATTSARALLGIPWSVKVFVGIISDCFPICGYRRRPFMIIGSGVTAITLALMGRYGLDWDWRHVIVLTTIAVVALDSVCTMLTTWDIVRNQWFWLGLPVVETIPSSVNFIVSSFVVVELADEGNEAAIYGLLTTVGNLSNPFSATLTKAIDEPFAVSNRDILNDSHSTRRDVTIIVLISYTSKLLSLLFLGWLPRQKAETQILKQCGNRSKLFGGITIVYCLFALTWSLLINLLGIFESTGA